jgi:hypothetical protein
VCKFGVSTANVTSRSRPDRGLRGRLACLAAACGLFGLVTLVVAVAPAVALTEFAPATFPLAAGAHPQAVAVGDFNGDGVPDIATANAGDDSVSLLLGNGAGGYSAATSFAVGQAPVSIATGDFNHDGKLDIVTADSAGDEVSVLLGDGAGSFSPAVELTTGADPQSVVVADLNGDSNSDIVTANAADNTVSVLLGDGTGGFAGHQDFAVGSSPQSVAVGDLDGDGAPDLVTANGGGDTFSVLLGRGDGTFKAKVDYSASTSAYANAKPAQVAIADFNGDGNPDVFLTGSENGYVTVALGKGDGTFTPRPGWFTDTFGGGLAVADLNGDGVPDVAVADGGVAVRLGSSDGRFYSMDQASTGTGACALAVADLNADGRPDLVSANGASDSVSVLLNTGTHAFGYRADCDITAGNPWNTTAVAVTDLNEDGKPDVVVAAANVIEVALGSGNGMFAGGDMTTPPGSAVESYPVDFSTEDAYSIVTGDFNGDGHQDVVAAFVDGFAFLPGDGHGHLGPAVRFGTMPTMGEARLATGDFNHDGKLDIVSTPSATTVGVDVYLGNGDGTFQAPIAVPAINGAPYSVVASPLAVGDLNKDGNADIVVGGGGYVDVLLGHGNGTFAPAVKYSAGTFTDSPVYFPEYVFIGDFTGDGNPDVVLDSVGGQVSVMKGNGDGTLGSPVASPLSNSTYGAPAVGDFNGDGKPDLVLVPNGQGDATVLLNRGDGTFLEYPSKALANNASANAIAATDFNGDGKPDLVVLSGIGMSTLLGTGQVPEAASFTLDGGAARTASLTMTADSAATGVTAMRFSAGGSQWTDWQPYADHATFTAGAGDGMRTVTAQYRDASGEVIALSHDITVDTTPPSISYGWTPGWNKDYTEVWISDSDVGSGVSSGSAKIEFRLDGGTWQVAAKESYVDVTIHPNGVHTFDFRCTDALGNQSNVISLPLKIDAAPPVTTVTGADDLWHRGDVTLTFTGVDDGIGVADTQYSLDGGGTWITGTSVTIYAHPDPAQGQVGGDGSHVVLYRSTDKFGHVETAKSCTVKINTTDVTPPSVSVTGADAAWHKAPYTLFFSATDDATGVASLQCSTDGGTTWVSASSVTISTGGVTNVLYRATDGAGNTTPTYDCKVKVDTTAPSTRAPAAATVRRGQTATLRYLIDDVAGQSPDTATIKIKNSHGKVVRSATITKVRLHLTLSYRFRCSLSKGTYRFSVYAKDGAGHLQTNVAANRLVVR